MPQYELMYILASSVSDDQVPALTEQIKTYVTDFGGTDVIETQLGKKKLAYPIKKTRNGFYGVINFSMDSRKVNDLDAKIRTQKNTVIRYILVNLDEHLVRLEKDKVAQASLPKRDIPPEAADAPEAKEAPVATEKVVEQKEKKAEPAIALMNAEELDKKIEAALSEDLTK